MERTPRAWPAALAIAAALAGAAGSAAGQQRIEQADLPRAVADDVVAAFNDPATLRLSAPASVAAGTTIVGDVGVLGGPVAVAGEIRGGLIVVNGDVVFAESGRVTGDLVVIGGDAEGADAGSVGGTLVVYHESLPYRRRGDRIEISEPRERRRPLRTDFGPGNAHFTIRAGTSYNRVEGLPVVFGPIVQTQGEHPFRVEVLGVWRTESGLSIDEGELGYRLRAEQRFGWAPRLAVGATLHSEVRPMEAGGLSDLETSLSTFFLHKDYRDHVEREGWSLYARAALPDARLEASAEYADERHAFAPVGSPWSLRDNDQPWRPQPLVGEGDLRTLTGTVLHDGRNDPEDPTDGWYAMGRLTRGVSGELSLPLYEGAGTPLADERVPVASRFTTGSFDLRRHLRVSPDADITLRLAGSGALGATPPPPQHQSALGGEGSLPGYRLFSLDCGARERTFHVPRDAGPGEDPVEPVFAAYGCDRALLFQAQYRGQLFFDLDLPGGEEDWEDGWDWYPAVDFSPAWVAFVNAGRGWVVDAPKWRVPGLARRGQTLTDVGFGVFLGDLGLLWAVPLRGDRRDLNFFVRLSRRF